MDIHIVKTDSIQKLGNVTGNVTIGNVRAASSDDRILKQTDHNMHGPDISQIEVQQSMASIREAASKTQEAPAFYLFLQVMIVMALAATTSSYKIMSPAEQFKSENDLTCYTCADMGSNQECNRWAPDKHCPIGHTVCETVHRFHRHSGKSIMVEKRCARPTECNIESIGCEKLHSKNHRHQMECRSCCTDSYCNREIPHNKTTSLQLSASMFTQTTSVMSRASLSPITALIVVTWFVITLT